MIVMRAAVLMRMMGGIGHNFNGVSFNGERTLFMVSIMIVRMGGLFMFVAMVRFGFFTGTGKGEYQCQCDEQI
jgi:hypothetical protein